MMNEEAVGADLKSPTLEPAAADVPPAALVSGSISLPSTEVCTLDEPVSATIVRHEGPENEGTPWTGGLRFLHFERLMQLRDVRLVAGKLQVVLMPKNTSDETLKALRDCTPYTLEEHACGAADGVVVFKGISGAR
jgi:hypothetical protein